VLSLGLAKDYATQEFESRLHYIRNFISS